MPSVRRRLSACTIFSGSLGLGLGAVALASWVGRGWKPFSLMSSRQLCAFRWVTGVGSSGGVVGFLALKILFRPEMLFSDLAWGFPRYQAALGALVTDPNVQDEQGCTPLMHALVPRANVRLVDALLDAGADPNVRNEQGITALHLRCFGGKTWVEGDDHTGYVMNRLLAFGPDANVGHAGRARDVYLVLRLLQCGAHVNVLHGGTGVLSTPLGCLLFGGPSEVTVVLLRHGAELRFGENPQRWPLRAANPTGFARGGRAERLIACYCLMDAVKHGDRQLVQDLLEAGVNPNSPDLLEADQGRMPMWHALTSQDQAMVELLRAHGVRGDSAINAEGLTVDGFLRGQPPQL